MLFMSPPFRMLTLEGLPKCLGLDAALSVPRATQSPPPVGPKHRTCPERPSRSEGTSQAEVAEQLRGHKDSSRPGRQGIHSTADLIQDTGKATS